MGGWGIHLNSIKMTIDAGALTGNGGNSNGSNDNNGEGNGNSNDNNNNNNNSDNDSDNDNGGSGSGGGGGGGGDGGGGGGGGVRIKASLRLSLDRMELLIRFPYQGKAIVWILDRFFGGRGRSRGDKGRIRVSEMIRSAENLFIALMLSVYIDSISLVIRIIRLSPSIAPNTCCVERVFVKNTGSELPSLLSWSS